MLDLFPEDVKTKSVQNPYCFIEIDLHVAST